MQVRVRDDRASRVQGGRTERTARERFNKGLLAPFLACMAIAFCLTMSPAKADFVCNAKTKLVNVFLQTPSYWPTTIPQNETALEMRDRVIEEQRRAARGPGYWSPADAMKEPFDLVDTLPSGSRVKVHALAENKGWVWISFRHTKNGLVGNGYVHSSRLSAIKCDADPKLEADRIEKVQLGIEDGDYFETGPDDPPLDGARGATPFGTTMISGAIRANRVYVQCEVPTADYPRPKDLSPGALQSNPYIWTCTEQLASNPNFLDALITRGDLYHRFAKAPAPGLDSKSPQWTEDIKHRKEAQAKAVADWTRASLLLPKGVPTVLEERLKPNGAAGYEVK